MKTCEEHFKVTFAPGVVYVPKKLLIQVMTYPELIVSYLIVVIAGLPHQSSFKTASGLAFATTAKMS